MSYIIVSCFSDIYAADEALLRVQRAQQASLAEFEEAVVLMRNGDGAVRVKPTYKILSADLGTSDSADLLIGALLIHPVLAVAAGIAGGALAGVPIDVGVGQQLIHDASERLVPGSSALIALVSRATPDLAIRAMAPSAWTTLAVLSSAQEDRLRGAVESGVESQSGHYDA
jgi:uncharacterized membrane protein